MLRTPITLAQAREAMLQCQEKQAKRTPGCYPTPAQYSASRVGMLLRDNVLLAGKEGVRP